MLLRKKIKYFAFLILFVAIIDGFSQDLRKLSFEDMLFFEKVDTAYNKDGGVRAIRYSRFDSIYSDDSRYGFIKKFNKKGRATFINTFGKDVDKRGFVIFSYHSNGNLKSKAVQQGLKYIGLFQKYHKNGIPRYTIQYDNYGKIFKVISQHNSFGQPVEVGTLNKGSGTFIVYDDDGIKEKVIYYENGKKVKEEKIKKSSFHQ